MGCRYVVVVMLHQSRGIGFVVGKVLLGMLGNIVCMLITISTRATTTTPCTTAHTRHCTTALQDMRTYKQAEEAGKKAGFKLITATDLAVASSGALPWYNRLRLNRFLFRNINGAIINFLCLFGMAPKGFNKVHDMLLDTVDALLLGGEKGIFTPMYMMVFEKPAV